MILYYTGADVVCVYLDYGVCVCDCCTYRLVQTAGKTMTQVMSVPARLSQKQHRFFTHDLVALGCQLAPVTCCNSRLHFATGSSTKLPYKVVDTWTRPPTLACWNDMRAQTMLTICGTAWNYITMLSFLKVAAASHAVVT